MVVHIDLGAALGFAQRDDRAEVFLWHKDGRPNNGLANLLDFWRFGQFGRVLDHHNGPVDQLDLVDDGGRGRYQIHVELSFEPLLHDLHVQQA